MGMARFFDFQVLALTLVMLAVVAGHIWPVQLGFSGGKGIVTSIAGLVLFHWQLALGMLGAGMIVYGFLKRFTLSGLCAFAAAPAIAIAFGLDGIRICGVAILSVMVLLAHRSNLVEEIAGKKKSGPLKTVKVH
jgi:glycerol-3-phosphate acyltransferase PlsY